MNDIEKLVERVRLTEEEIEKAARDWMDEDWTTRTIQLNRGHWEYIAPIIAQAATKKALSHPDLYVKDKNFESVTIPGKGTSWDTYYKITPLAEAIKEMICGKSINSG